MIGAKHGEVQMTSYIPQRPVTWGEWLTFVWGACGVLAVLSQAVWKLAPLTWAAFVGGQMLPYHWLIVVLWVCANAYMEGYRGFQLSYSPMVAERLFSLRHDSPWHHRVLAPFYGMGMFAAPKRRMIVAWTLVVVISLLIVVIRRLPQPWRGIVDAGVVVGLMWGALSFVVFLVRGALGHAIPKRRERKRRSSSSAS